MAAKKPISTKKLVEQKQKEAKEQNKPGKAYQDGSFSYVDSSGNPITQEQFVEQNKSRNFSVGAKTNLTFEEAQKESSLRQNLAYQKERDERLGLNKPDTTANVSKAQEIISQEQPIEEQNKVEGGPIIEGLKKVTEIMGAEFTTDEQGKLSLNPESVPNLAQNAVTTGAAIGVGVGLITGTATKVAASSLNIGKSSGSIIKNVLGFVGVSSITGVVISNANAITNEVQGYTKTMEEIKEAVDLGGDPYSALKQLNDIQSSLNEAERALKTISLSTGYLKIMGKIRDKRIEVENQKMNLLNTQTYILNKVSSGESGL